MYYKPTSRTIYVDHTPAGHGWAGETFLRQRKKVPPAQAQRVYLEKGSYPAPPILMSLSVCNEYQNT